jgi:hypothetical protein
MTVEPSMPSTAKDEENFAAAVADALVDGLPAFGAGCVFGAIFLSFGQGVLLAVGLTILALATYAVSKLKG